MKTRLFPHCEAILFDFGGTLDSDGEHWLDRFYELYEQAGFDLPQAEIKRAFYIADQLCYNDPRVVSMGLRTLMKHHVRLQFAALNLKELAKEEEIIERFCAKTERTLQRNAATAEAFETCLSAGRNFQFLRQCRFALQGSRIGGFSGCDSGFRRDRGQQA